VELLGTDQSKSLTYTATSTNSLMSHEYKTFSICSIKYILWHFCKELDEIIIYLLLLSPLIPESCPIFFFWKLPYFCIFYYYHHWYQKVSLFLQAWFMKIGATHKVLTFKTTIPNTAKPLQLISSLFKIYTYLYLNKAYNMLCTAFSLYYE